MSELPAGWAEATIADLAGATGLVTDGDWIESKDQDPNGEVRLIQLADIGDGDFRDRSSRFVTTETAQRLRCTQLESGDLLVARMPDPLGRACIFPGLAQPAITAVDVFVWRGQDDGPDARWLMHAINSPKVRDSIAGQAGGTTRQRIAGGRLKQLSLPVPPLPEQRRIVVKIDSLTSKSRRARDHLDHITRLVEKYKQAVLAAAFRGDLTREWRRQHSDRLNGSNNISDFALDDSERGRWPSDILPEQWEWRTFRGTYVDLTDSTRKLPQNAYLSKGQFPVVDQGERLVGGYTDRTDLLHPAEPPFIIFGDHTRCVKYVNECFVQGADGVKVLHTVADVRPLFGRFALLAVNLPDKGYSRHMKFVRATLFPVAPSQEQQEIIRRIETAFTWIDRLAAEATNARKLIGRLDQAVLAKAFRGELVPQDPADEPACVLLERISAGREEAPKTKRGQKVKAV